MSVNSLVSCMTHDDFSDIFGDHERLRMFSVRIALYGTIPYTTERNSLSSLGITYIVTVLVVTLFMSP